MIYFNHLPDELLMKIFQLDYNLDNLNNYSKVCFRWRQLIFSILHKLNCLKVDTHLTKYHVGFYHTVPFPYHGTIGKIEILQFIPKLKFLVVHDLYSPADDNGETGPKLRMVIDILASVKSIKGIIFGKNQNEDCLAEFCGNVEMLSFEHSGEFHVKYFDFYGYGANLKQLHVNYFSFELLGSFAHFIPNLERLHLRYMRSSSTYNGPVLRNLKILSLVNIGRFGFDGFRFIDFCPSLKSIFICLDYIYEFDVYQLDESLKNNRVEDLVIETAHHNSHNINTIKKFLSKFPNLKHFAFRGGPKVYEISPEEFVAMFPKLVLLDVRGAKFIGRFRNHRTRMTEYCKKVNRSIKFIQSQEDLDHVLADDHLIVKGLDFMKYCFFKMHSKHPKIMDYYNCSMET